MSTVAAVASLVTLVLTGVALAPLVRGWITGVPGGYVRAGWCAALMVCSGLTAVAYALAGSWFAVGWTFTALAWLLALSFAQRIEAIEGRLRRWRALDAAREHWREN